MRRQEGDNPHPPWKRIAAAGYYASASMLVQFVNKALFTTYKFQYPFTVALLQMLVIAPVCYAVSRPKLDLSLTKSIAPLAVVNVSNVVCGLIGTGGLTVPMFIALRRFTLLFTIGLERLWLSKHHDAATLTAVAIMIIGAIVAAVHDLSFNFSGYLAVLGNDFLTALYLVMVKATPQATKGLSTTGLLFYNSALSIPLLLVAVVCSREPWSMLDYPLLFDRDFQVVIAMSTSLGLTINHSTFICTIVNEPLMTSVAGNFKNVLMTIVGAIAFPDYQWHPWNAAGLAISMAGAVWYATRAALRTRKKSAKELLAQVKPPVIGRDRMRDLLNGSELKASNSVSSLKNGSSDSTPTSTPRWTALPAS